MGEIEAFEAIVRLGGFTRAAEGLRVSQPTISRRVELLERELGAPLFERGVGGSELPLTDVGRTFLPYAQQVLAAARDGLEAVRALEKGEAGTVNLALVGTLASTDLTVRLKSFREEHPDVRVVLRTARSDEVSELVRSGEVTLGLRYFADDHPSVICKEVGEESLVVVCAAESRLVEGRPEDPGKLRGVPWVSFPVSAASSGEAYARALRQRLVRCGLEEVEVVEVDSLTAQKRLIEADFGVGLLPRSSVEEELRAGTLRELEIPALQATIPVAAIHRRHGYLSRAARDLLAELASDRSD